ncbi:hypothetical protein SDC9_195453 [bioreactor metagenome]|uniref:Uncharacterized protein n=1 Tax=bioreactor metagenome TaxID=1076179 RepID=A0A645IBL4_9ZZZZ
MSINVKKTTVLPCAGILYQRKHEAETSPAFKAAVSPGRLVHLKSHNSPPAKAAQIRTICLSFLVAGKRDISSSIIKKILGTIKKPIKNTWTKSCNNQTAIR